MAGKTTFRFDPEWRITLFTVLLVPLMVALGFWQLERAEEKRTLAATFEARRDQAPRPVAELWGQAAQDLAYLPVQLSGRFRDAEYFLLDNQVRDGRVGYEVLDILQLDGQQGSVVVNRGWIPADADRSVMPQVPRVDGPVQISGQVYVAPGKPYLLADEALSQAWPQRIQAIEMEKIIPAIDELLGGEVFPFPVRINAQEDAALVADWPLVNSSEQKHQAYAVQWFSMAAVLCIFYLLRSSNIWQCLTGSDKEES